MELKRGQQFYNTETKVIVKVTKIKVNLATCTTWIMVREDGEKRMYTLETFSKYVNSGILI